MVKILFIWNIASSNANIGAYKPSVWAAKQKDYLIDVAMNYSYVTEEIKKKVEEELGIRLIHIDINRSPTAMVNFKAYRQLVKLMKEEEYDIIHCNTPMGGILGRLAAFRTNNRRVFYMNRGFHFYKGAPKKNWILFYPIERIFARCFTDAIATINPIDFQYANNFTLRGHSNLKYSLPGPGVELDQYKYSEEDRRTIRNQFGFGKDDVVIISVGELSIRKNNSLIIEALALINDSHIYYMLVGDGPVKNKLKELAKEKKIEKNVVFAGEQQNPTPYYSAADIFVFPSLNEGFGRAGIEAMHVGLPIVTSNVQGINLYSEHGKTGYKYNPKDVKGFAQGILELVKNKKLRKEISEYNKVESEKFSLENTGRQIAEIYQALLKK